MGSNGGEGLIDCSAEGLHMIEASCDSVCCGVKALGDMVGSIW